jgi:hypothetical protein
MRFFLSLLWQAFLLTVSWMGTSALAIAVKVLLVPVGVLLVKLYRQGWSAVWEHAKENLKATVVVTVGVWASLILFNLLYTVPHAINLQAENTPPPPGRPPRRRGQPSWRRACAVA